MKQEGYIALISVLVISAAITLIAVNTSLLSIGESEMGLQKSHSFKAYYLANACGEEALEKIREVPNFGGRGRLSFQEGDCSYNVIKGEGEERTIEAQGSIYSVVRKIEVRMDQINPTINVISWEGVGNF